MDNYIIPPDYGLIISALSRTKSLREAATLLNMDPAGLVRKVQKIQAEFGLVEKLGNRWVATEKGLRISRWTQECISRQKFLLDERATMRLASFSWLAEEMLIPNLKKLTQDAQNKYDWSLKTIAPNLEHELISGRSDLVITGHPPTDPTIAYKKVRTYPWKVIAPSSWKKKLDKVSKSELESFLKKSPYVRLSAIPPEQTLRFKPEVYSDISVDGVIGVRTAVAQGCGWSCVPAMSIKSLLSAKQVMTLDLQVNTVDEFSLWWLRSRRDVSEISKNVLRWMSTLDE